ncbi:hypothetical protein CR513_12092, partial [Mucuna pruriens]
MGNNNSAISKTHGSQKSKVASIETRYVVPMLRKLSTKPEVVGSTEEHGEKALDNDVTFSNYIQRAKYKIRSITNNGFHEEQSYPAPKDVANATINNKENEKDHFSDFILNSRKKLRTISRKNSSFRIR